MKEWHNHSLNDIKYMSPISETDNLINGPSKQKTEMKKVKVKDQKEEVEHKKKNNRLETLANTGKDWSNGLRGDSKPLAVVKKAAAKKKPISQFEPTSIASKKTGTIPDFH